MSAPSGHPVYSSEALVFTNRIQASEEPYDRLHSPQWLTAQGFKRAAEYDVETGWQMVVNQLRKRLRCRTCITLQDRCPISAEDVWLRLSTSTDDEAIDDDGQQLDADVIASDTDAVKYRTDAPVDAFNGMDVDETRYWMTVIEHYEPTHHIVARASRPVVDDKTGKRVDEVFYLLVPLSKRRKIGDASDDDGTRRPVPDQACWSLASWIDRSERDTNNLGAEMDDWEPALMTFEAQSYGVALGLQVHGIAIDVESGIAMLTPDLEYWERLDMYKVRLASARETGYGWRDREKAKKAVRMQSKLGSGIPKRVMLLDMTPGLATEGFREIVGKAFAVAGEPNHGNVFWLYRSCVEGSLGHLVWLFEDEVTSPEAWLQFQHCAFHVAAPARPSRFRRGGVHIAVIWAPNIEGLSGIEVDGTLDGLVEMFNRGQGRAGTSDEDGDSAMDGSGDGEDSRGGTGGAERDGDEDSRDEGAPAAETTVVTRRRRAGTEAGMREITVGMQALWARARKRREL